MVLRKVNRDSQDAVSCLAQSVGVAHRAFATAGTKDKRGVTTQFVTAWNVRAICLRALVAAYRSTVLPGLLHLTSEKSS